ncbi:hypothetical protein RI129_008409 [Pyrocoelia pectoralis]|uniref:Glutathione S-transferase n=1 Tax=Pyrocoelia pectoralis TaxID=417401 RepID=A0AAN7ZG06_9COLE
MSPILYYNELSAPSRSVLMTAKAIGLDLNIKIVDMMNGEHRNPEILKMNPQHTLPILDDNGYYIWDSHAINIYLVSTYAKNDSLYPQDPQKRGAINQRLLFNVSVMQAEYKNIAQPLLLNTRNTISQEQRNLVHTAYGFLESFLDGNTFIAGHSLTIADLSIVTIVSSLTSLVPINQYSRLSAWFQRMQELPYYKELNQIGSDKMANILKSKIVNH